MKLVQVQFPDSQYYKEQQIKKQIVLHHTASGRGVDGDFRHWLNDPSRIATCVIIDYTGMIHQCFNSVFWGHHLGTSLSNNTTLNKQSIAVEIDAWGALLKIGDKYYSYTGAEVPANEVTYYENGFKTMPLSDFFAKNKVVNKPAYYYHKYSKEQIDSLVELIRLWNAKYKIPMLYHEDMWDVSKKATSGVPGIWSHVSYRKDKADCHPQPELIEALKKLSL